MRRKWRRAYWRIGEADVFPEQFDSFLVSEPRAREIFYEYTRSAEAGVLAGEQELVARASRRTSSPTARVPLQTPRFSGLVATRRFHGWTSKASTTT